MSFRTSVRIAAALVGAATLTIGLAPLAGAQDPYGSTTTTAPVEVEATCSLSVPQGAPGTTVTASVAGVFLGERVQIRFDGRVVGEGRAPAVAAASTGTAVAFNGGAIAAQAVPTAVVNIKFVVPNTTPGTHIVTAVGDTFTCFCDPKGEFKVLAVVGKGGSLARTGVSVALALVVAAGLLLVGRVLLGTSHRRRAAEKAHEERVLSHVGR